MTKRELAEGRAFCPTSLLKVRLEFESVDKQNQQHTEVKEFSARGLQATLVEPEGQDGTLTNIGLGYLPPEATIAAALDTLEEHSSLLIELATSRQLRPRAMNVFIALGAIMAVIKKSQSSDDDDDADDNDELTVLRELRALRKMVELGELEELGNSSPEDTEDTDGNNIGEGPNGHNGNNKRRFH